MTAQIPKCSKYKFAQIKWKPSLSSTLFVKQLGQKPTLTRSNLGEKVFREEEKSDFRVWDQKGAEKLF